MGLFGGSFGGFFGGGFSGFFGGNSSGSGSSGGFNTKTNIVMDEKKIFKELKEIAKKDEDSIAGELFTILDEGKAELTEICTDGFIEMVIKGNENYKTSFEIRDEVDDMIASQNNKYKNKCLEINKLLKNLNEHITNLYKRKYEIATYINIHILDYSPTFSFSIPTNFISNLTYTDYQNNYNILTDSIIPNSQDREFIDTLLEQHDRKAKVNEYRQYAEDYKIYISRKIAELNIIESNINAIEIHLKEEDILLDGLETSIKINRKLEYKEIAQQLQKMVALYILDEHGERNKLYVKSLESLKALCKNV